MNCTMYSICDQQYSSFWTPYILNHCNDPELSLRDIIASYSDHIWSLLHHTSRPLVEGQKGTVWLGYALFFLNNNLYVSPDSNNIFDG